MANRDMEDKFLANGLKRNNDIHTLLSSSFIKWEVVFGLKLNDFIDLDIIMFLFFIFHKYFRKALTKMQFKDQEFREKKK